MEIALPLAAIAGCYLVSKSDETPKAKKEGFESTLPNVSISPSSYPVGKPGKTVADYPNPATYPNPQASASKYFAATRYEELAEKSNEQFTSLTGNDVPASDFVHNNMQPFFGSRVRQRTTNLDGNESLLDNMQGSGSQHFSKREQAPLFKPEENMHWPHGTPNHSEFIQSRMNPSRNMSNVKPWQEIHVAPGLDDGYGSTGRGGFNASLMARDKWISKSVSELRAKNNPKVTYGGVVLGGKHFNGERGIEGRVEKNRPDTFVANCGGERFLTTTGEYIKPTARSEQMLGYSNRVETTQEYYGGVGKEEGESTYIPGHYQDPHRPVLDPDVAHLSNAFASGKHDPTTGDYGVQGYKQLTNNKTITTERTPNIGAIATIAKAIVLPIQDALRPSRKQNTIGNARNIGQAGSAVSGQYVYNPHDRTKTTKKETTIDNPQRMNVGNSAHQGYGYLSNAHQPAHTQRSELCASYTGPAGNSGVNLMTSYASDYNMTCNPSKELTLAGRTNGGNMSMFNGQQNIQVGKLDSDRARCRVPAPARQVKNSPSIVTHGRISSQCPNDQTQGCARLEPAMVEQLSKNPYSHPIGSFA